MSHLDASKMIRLLQYNNDSEFSLATFFADKIPQEYAILSHTWEAEEVTFEDLQNGTGTKKAGYNKIRFCGEQARRDGLQYFWVDTCCIDRSSSAALSEAIKGLNLISLILIIYIKNDLNNLIFLYYIIYLNFYNKS